MTQSTTATADRAGWSIPAFCAACNFSRPYFYKLELRPRSIKLGKRHIIIEEPSAYLARVAAAQEIAA